MSGKGLLISSGTLFNSSGERRTRISMEISSPDVIIADNLLGLALSKYGKTEPHNG